MSSLSNKGSTTKWRKLRDEVIRRDGGTCQRCGMPGNHVDHIVPRRLADPSIADSLDNLQLLCSNCNLRKGGRFFESDRTPLTLPVLFYPENGSITHYKDE
jgi:5-methylcytosine-specific restriction endonuclease McrA